MSRRASGMNGRIVSPTAVRIKVRHDPGSGGRTAAVPPIPSYIYPWAYIWPRAIRLWDRLWLINLITFGQYRHMSDRVLSLAGEGKHVLLLGACYGDLVPRLARHNQLTVVDVVPDQLRNLARKSTGAELVHADAENVPLLSGYADIVLCFFLLHEIPPAHRPAVLREVARLAGPEGKVILVDYTQPPWWSPLGWLLRIVLPVIEPYAKTLWRLRLAGETDSRMTACLGCYQLVATTGARMERTAACAKMPAPCL